MRIAFIAAGAGGMYCGSCLRDNALALATRALGHEMTLVPAYTPLRLDDEDAAEKRVFLGALEVYLQEKLPFLARPWVLGRILGSQRLLGWISRFALTGSPETMGRLTVSMLRGESGSHRRSIDELAGWLKTHVCPEVVHLSNALLCGLARPLGEKLGVPVVCGLQGEDLFLDGLGPKHRDAAIQLIRERSQAVGRFVATSRYYAVESARLLGIDPERIDVVLSGIRLADYASPRSTPNASGDGGPVDRSLGDRTSGDISPGDRRPLTIGYFARLAPEKGLHVLAEAFARLASSGDFPNLRLRVAGYLGGKGFAYAAAVRHLLASRRLSDRVEVLGTLGKRDKIEFLRSLDVFSVPTVYPDPKGIFVLEALASGVPVVAPDHGVFPEILESTRGGLLHAPADAEDLAEKLRTLLLDPALRRSLGEAGRAAVFERFSAERMARDTLEVYRKVLGAGATGPGASRLDAAGPGVTGPSVHRASEGKEGEAR